MNKRREIGVVACLLLLCFALQVMSARLKSPTYDEQVYIARGYAFVRLGDLHMLVGEPVLLNALNALPLLALPGVRLPVDHPSWAGTDFHPISEQFMWHMNDNAEQILFMARVPTMLLALLLIAFVYRWARECFGPWGGLLAATLCALDPNLIAHGRLATTDLGSTAFILIAAYWLWQLLRRPSWQHVLATGVFLGLAQASRFSALLFGPGFVLLFLWRACTPLPFALPWPGWRACENLCNRQDANASIARAGPLGRRSSASSAAARRATKVATTNGPGHFHGWPWMRRSRRATKVATTNGPGRFQGRPWVRRWAWLAAAAGAVLAVACLTIWAVHGFQVGPIAGRAAFPVPAPSYFEQFFYIWGRLAGQEGRQVVGFLMGELYVGGRWQYFPVAFALKTPIPTLILLAGAILLSLREWGAGCSRRIRDSAECRPGCGPVADWPGAERRDPQSLIAAIPAEQNGPLLLPDRQIRAALWLPPLVFFILALNSKINLGYRYILPVVPFVIVLAGRMGQWLAEGMSRFGRSRRALLAAAASAVVGWSAWSGLVIYPHYLAFFNEWAGGPDNGWQFLVDSNIDWGQDLKGLKRWMDEHGVARIKLGYMGEGVPAYYGIDFDALPSTPDRWEHPLHHDLYFQDPAPGLYAISANLIQGRTLADPDTYAWFREREPLDKVGYSIFIYDVPAHGQGQAVIGLSGLVPPDICPQDYAWLGTNDVRVLWFDVGRSLIVPAGDGQAFFFVAGDTRKRSDVHPALRPLWPWAAGQETRTCDGRSLRWFEGDLRGALAARTAALAPASPVWHLPAAQFAPGEPAASGERLSLPVDWGQVELLAYEMDIAAPAESAIRRLHPGQALTLVTYWRVRQPATEPLQLFVHLLDAGGTYRGGEDRMDVWYANWQAGDAFAQVQEVRLDEGAGPGEYQVEVGWYTPRMMARLPVLRGGEAIADRVLLAPVRVE